MGESSPQGTTVGVPAQMLRNSARWRVDLALCVLCAGLAVAFLLKGEDTAYYAPAADRSFETHGVSAYAYYFVWPKSQRETVAQNEEFVAVLNSMTGVPPPSTLPDRMQRNLILAIFFGVASAILAIAGWVMKSPHDTG